MFNLFKTLFRFYFPTCRLNMHLSLLLYLFLLHELGALEVTPQVEIPSGIIKGFVERSVSGRQFYTFNGIPYAEPPTAKNRFQAASPKKPWMGIIKANTKHECLQYTDTARVKNGSTADLIHGLEDCLYVNVHSPDLKGNLNVIVFIHGGGFGLGSGSGQGKPYILLDKDIVFVTFNYRVGILGFLSTEDNVVPGNNGLKDQILAMKWIKENIHHFGGNPNSITLTGSSAGAASVHFHTLSQKSKGLFHRAVSLSGTMLNPWTLMEKPLEKTKKIASIVGCQTEDVPEMVDCLVERPGKQILSAVYKLHAWQFTPFSPFAPVVDQWSIDPVLPEHPYKLLKDKKVNDVPWILAQMEVEGHCNGFEYNSASNLKYLDEHWNELMPHILQYNYTIDRKDIESVGNKIRKQYFGDETISLKNLDKLLTLIGDRVYNVDFDKSARLQAEAIKSPVYLYLFYYRGTHSASEITAKTNENLGVSHGDSNLYIISPLVNNSSTKEDREMSRVMVDLFLSFIESSQPMVNNVEWIPISKDLKDPIKCMKIYSPSMATNEIVPELGNRSFWDSLPFLENNNLFNEKL